MSIVGVFNFSRRSSFTAFFFLAGPTWFSAGTWWTNWTLQFYKYRSFIRLDIILIYCYLFNYMYYNFLNNQKAIYLNSRRPRKAIIHHHRVILEILVCFFHHEQKLQKFDAIAISVKERLDYFVRKKRIFTKKLTKFHIFASR